MTHSLSSVRAYFFLTVLTGLLYPLIVTLVGKTAFPYQAGGSLIESQGRIVGSELIAQKFEAERYFWARPSATDFNPLPSGGSNLGPTSGALKEAVTSRLTRLGAGAPMELGFASASGLDPEISPEGALYQVPRVAKARGVPEEVVRSRVVDAIAGRQLGVFGEERVNVLKLNLALDERR